MMTKEQDPNQWHREEFERMKKELAEVLKIETILDEKIQSDKERELLPTLQRFDSLSQDVKLLVEQLEQVDDDVKELKKEILKN
jgi:hypothetical protein